MQKLSDKDYQLFKSIASMKQTTLKRTLSSILDKKYKTVIKTPEYLYAIGDIPIALVAHMDTVFKSPPQHIYYDERKGVIWSPEGLGADDRAGVFMILKILQTGLRPTIIFTTDEEKGALGAEKLVKDTKEPFSELNYIIQLDRRGTCDCVFYDCANQEFIQYVEAFGFLENFGTFSDISEICPVWGIAGVNLSVGYEDEHTVSETFHIKPWFATLRKVQKMLQEEHIPKFIYIPDDKSWYRYGYRIPYSYSWFDYEDDYICSGCGKHFSEYEMIPVEIDGEEEYYCPDCCVNRINWCSFCGNPFKVEEPGQTICPSCAEKRGINITCSTKKSKKSSMK